MAVTRFADDETIAELERQARRIAELAAALAAIHATSRRVTHAKLQAARGDEREVCARQVRQFIKSEKLTGKTAELVERIARSVECPF